MALLSLIMSVKHSFVYLVQLYYEIFTSYTIKYIASLLSTFIINTYFTVVH